MKVFIKSWHGFFFFVSIYTYFAGPLFKSYTAFMIIDFVCRKKKHDISTEYKVTANNNIGERKNTSDFRCRNRYDEWFAWQHPDSVSCNFDDQTIRSECSNYECRNNVIAAKRMLENSKFTAIITIQHEIVMWMAVRDACKIICWLCEPWNAIIATPHDDRFVPTKQLW